jgi:hypothetical protein
MMKIVQVHSYDELSDHVAENQGLLKVQMSLLRDLEGAGRLGKLIRDKIHGNLLAAQMGHLPVELPNDQWDYVRIYRRDFPIGNVIEAILNPNDAGDKLLRNLSGKEAEKKLSELRVLLEEATELIDS